MGLDEMRIFLNGFRPNGISLLAEMGLAEVAIDSCDKYNFFYTSPTESLIGP